MGEWMGKLEEIQEQKNQVAQAAKRQVEMKDTILTEVHRLLLQAEYQADAYGDLNTVKSLVTKAKVMIEAELGLGK